MIVLHNDSDGRRWSFTLAGCSKPQAAAFARLLRAVTNTRVYKYRSPGLKETPTEQRNRHFCARIERDVLEALAAKYLTTEADKETNEYFGL